MINIPLSYVLSNACKNNSAFLVFTSAFPHLFLLQAFVNKILLDGQFFGTRNGILIGVSEVLPVQKNRCSTNTTTVQKVKHW